MKWTQIYKAVLVAVASQENKKSEKLENGIWSEIEEPPVGGSSMSSYAVIFHAGHHYYFGGFDQEGGDSLSSVIALKENTWTWSNIGEMNSARFGHGVIRVGGMFMLVGGRSMSYNDDKTGYNNEVCLFENNEFSCTNLSSSLNDYSFYPILHLVDENYKISECACKDGFDENVDGICIDINECSLATHNCPYNLSLGAPNLRVW